VCGGSGGIGQPLAMLMAMDENVAELCVQDVSMAMVPHSPLPPHTPPVADQHYRLAEQAG